MTRIPAFLTLSITAILLSACAATPPGTPLASTPPAPAGLTVEPIALPDPTVNHPGQVAPRFDYVATVPVHSGDTVASLQTASGGTVVSITGTDCADTTCHAVIGLNAAAGAPPPSAHTLSTALNRSVTVDTSRDQISGGGATTARMGGMKIAWASGELQAWAGGMKIAWASGTYAPIPQNTQTWQNVRLESAQARATNLGAGTVVAVIDTGIDVDHVAFQGALTEPATWWDFYAGDAVPQEEGTLGTGGYGHGTNVAGIILQVAPRAKIMPLRVLGPDGSGDVSSIVSAINWAVARGAHVINLSLGTDTDAPAIKTALAAAASKNVLAVASVGNAARRTLTFPAQYGFDLPLMLSVASVDLTGAKSTFSNYGVQTEVVAPGENVYAPAPGNMMAAWTGTSQAAPIVSGGLALALGQTTRKHVASLPGAVSHSATNSIYDRAANWPYGGQLGSGQIDLAALMNEVVD